MLKDIPSLPVGVKECLTKPHFPLNKSDSLTIISTYAPTHTCLEDTKTISLSIKTWISLLNYLLLARVGEKKNDWTGVLGKQRLGKLNSNDPLEQMHRAQIVHHQHHVQVCTQIQDHLDAPQVKTVAFD